jgi:hypothetical protein
VDDVGARYLHHRNRSKAYLRTLPGRLGDMLILRLGMSFGSPVNTSAPEMTARVERHPTLLLEARASQQAGLPAASPQARGIAERVAADSAESVAVVRLGRNPTWAGRRERLRQHRPRCVDSAEAVNPAARSPAGRPPAG